MVAVDQIGHLTLAEGNHERACLAFAAKSLLDGLSDWVTVAAEEFPSPKTDSSFDKEHELADMLDVGLEFSLSCSFEQSEHLVVSTLLSELVVEVGEALEVLELARPVVGVLLDHLGMVDDIVNVIDVNVIPLVVFVDTVVLQGVGTEWLDDWSAKINVDVPFSLSIANNFQPIVLLSAIWVWEVGRDTKLCHLVLKHVCFLGVVAIDNSGLVPLSKLVTHINIVSLLQVALPINVVSECAKWSNSLILSVTDESLCL